MPDINLTLSAYDCHRLLSVLNRSLSFINTNNKDATELWEKISTQLHGTECVIYGSQRWKELNPPKEEPKKEPDTKVLMEEAINYAVDKHYQRMSWFAKLFVSKKDLSDEIKKYVPKV
jgi:hypothetical protein